jgi:hypothetical protein
MAGRQLNPLENRECSFFKFTSALRQKFLTTKARRDTTLGALCVFVVQPKPGGLFSPTCTSALWQTFFTTKTQTFLVRFVSLWFNLKLASYFRQPVLVVCQGLFCGLKTPK